jgi:AcrR family transcriptional regulator
MPVPASRRTPLQARSNKTVEEILDAASALLGQVPFDEITTSRVAQHAGISVGALYRFYSDKQEIFDAIAVRELDTFRAGIERAFTARQLIFSPRKSLGRVLDAYVDFLEASWRWAAISATGRAKTSRTHRPGQAAFSGTCW